MPIQQLPLWDAPPMPTPEPAPSGRPVLPEGGYYPDEVQITQSHWADGDNRPEQLEKLARLRLGDTNFVKFTWPCKHGKYAVYRAISTAVVGEEVLIAWEYEQTDVEFFCHLPKTPVQEIIDEWLRFRENPGDVQVDDEEEDVA